MEFYYPNFQNDMWRILGLIFFADKNHFVEPGKRFSRERAVAFCEEIGLGLGDTAMEVIRHKSNASDKFLEVVTPFSPTEVLEKTVLCEAIVVTGQKAMDTLLGVIPDAKEPAVGDFTTFRYASREMRLYRMPSSSRAYPKALEEKAAIYAAMFQELRMI